MIKVLAIGNSFSQDAETYIHQIAAASGIELMMSNLYIGGCPLERHHQNLDEDAAAYEYTKTGAETRMASIREALEEEKWDYVTMQQVSGLSGLYETYQPHLSILSEYVKKYAPQAEQLIHETWAYEIDSVHSQFGNYDSDQFKMYMALRAAYEQALQSASGGLKLALEEPFQYQWPYMSAFLNMPLDGSEYMYTDEEVPFLTIALKGLVPMYSDYVNFEANKTELFLTLAETGVYPSFYITRKNSSDLIYTNSSDLYSTQWDAYRETVVQYDRELRTLNARTAGASIVNHEKLDGDVRKVTYSNGITVYVNYSGETRTADGVAVGPKSFSVAEKAAGGETP